MDNTARKPKVGDMVTLKPLVVTGLSDYNGVFWADLSQNGTGFKIHESWIASIEPRALRVGDRVAGKPGLNHSPNGVRATIIAISGSRAWVQGDGVDWVYSTSDLTRVEDKP